MTSKYYCFSMRIIILLYAICSGTAWSITAEELETKYQSAANAIQDISLEYDWRILPPWTFEEVMNEMGGADILLNKDGFIKYKLTAGRFVDPNDPSGRQRWRYVCEESATVIAKGGQSWNSFVKYSYDGQVYRKFHTGGWPGPVVFGVVSPNDLNPGIPLLSPMGFSIFRQDSGKDIPLSAILGQNKDMVRATDNTISKVNDFNAVHVELLQKKSKLPYIRIYFSVDHNYAPVKYEYLKNLKTGEISYIVEAHSLEQIADGLWFPTGGLIREANEERATAYQVTSRILLNQGLTEKDFDITFPPGTEITDQITGRSYKVGAENK